MLFRQISVALEWFKSPCQVEACKRTVRRGDEGVVYIEGPDGRSVKLMACDDCWQMISRKYRCYREISW
jgi:hypothetical protein